MFKNSKTKLIIFHKYFRRITLLEQDIRHAYVEMKTLLQAEEKVMIFVFVVFINYRKFLGTNN